MTSRPDHDRFLALLQEHARILQKVVRTYCRNGEELDLVQEISAQLWKAFASFDKQRKFSTWMYRIALNVAISWARATGRRQRSVSLEASFDPVDPRVAPREPDDRASALHRFIQGCDELNRALLLLYLEEHSYREISEVLGITETNVATKLSRLKQRIHASLSSLTPH